MFCVTFVPSGQKLPRVVESGAFRQLGRLRKKLWRAFAAFAFRVLGGQRKTWGSVR